MARPAKKAQVTAAAPAAAVRVNPHRGEASITLGKDKFTLCLSMNALVEIEQAMGVPLARLGEVLAQPSMLQIRSIVGALVRGGGYDLTDEDVGRQMLDLPSTMTAIEAAFAAAGVFQAGASEDENASKNVTRPT